MGRTSYDASQEIRNRHLNRDEGKLLVKKYDGEFPDKYFDEIMYYLEIDKEEFHKLCNEFRSPHLWINTNKEGFKLRHTVNGDGEND